MASTKRPTATSNFGVSRRENHDASGFYARFTAPVVSDDALVDAAKCVDEIFCGSAADMAEVADRSVALVVTSPPYFAGKEYEEALGVGGVPSSYLDYLGMLEDVFAECVRKLEPGGRIAVNVANLGRKPYRSLSADVIGILQDRLRLLLRGEVIWQKGRGATGSCAWGSFQRPTNPVLRDLTERVVIASKGRFDRAIPMSRRLDQGLPSESSLSRDEFMEATTDVWHFPAESATRVGHPAPFPVELPERLIHLNTFRKDLVLDPFMGSGTTAVAAIRTGRHYAGYDTDAGYVARARERARSEAERIATGDTRDGAYPRIPISVPVPAGDGAGGDPVAAAIAAGLATKDIALEVVTAAGFADIATDVLVGHGVRVTLSGRDVHGREWLFDVHGGLTTSLGGLRSTEVMWRALGRAAVVHELAPSTPLVLLTTDTPPLGSAADRAMRATVGPDKAVRAVLRLLDTGDRASLAGLCTG